MEDRCGIVVGRFGIVVDCCGIVVGGCGIVVGSLWVVVDRCGSFRVLVITSRHCTLSTVFLRPSTVDVKILTVVTTVSNLVSRASSLLKMSCNWEATLCVISKASIILSSSPGLSVMASSTCEALSQRLFSSSSGDMVSRSESLVLFFLLKRL